ncbi:MAG: hypothetical protein M3R02_11060 [Chloroflexota bacterium]|nr:hypothetical protein [Chloroflexota bacterium]
MRGRSSVWTRSRRLAAIVGDPTQDGDEETVIRRQVEVIAAERGVPVGVLLAEAEVTMARWAVREPVTWATVVERVAMEHGVDPEAVRGELATMGLRWGP